MSTHRRAWMVRAGVIATVVIAGLFGLVAPAMADDPTVTITSLSSGSLQAGESATLKYTVKNNNKLPDGQSSAMITISFAGFQNGEISCTGNPSCDFNTTILPGQTSNEFTATIKAGNVPAGQTRNGSVHIKVSIGNGNNADVPRNITVQGPAATQPPAATTVPEVSGTVLDATNNQPIGTAKVSIQDSAGTTWTVGTDTAGKFKITSTQDKPIKPGTIAFMVEKDGIQTYTQTKQAIANQALTGVRLAVTPAATTPTAAAVGPSAELNTPADISSLDTGGNVAAASNNSGGGLSWILIAVGAILVALGVGAIVLLFVRKKDEDDPDGQDPNAPRRGGPPAQQGPPGRGGPRPPQRRGPSDMGPPMRSGPGPDPTRQMRPPVSPGPRGDQTMISPSPLANAPTQLHGRIPPEQADPYGAPPPRHNGGQPGYGQNPYGAAGGGGPSAATSAYPGGSPTYGQGPDQYGQQGYGQGPGTDPYGPQQGGYGQPGHNGQDGYNPAQGGGYEPRGQRPGPTQPPAQPDPRRVDWLDD